MENGSKEKKMAMEFANIKIKTSIQDLGRMD